MAWAEDLFGEDAEEPHPGRVCSPEISHTPVRQALLFIRRETHRLDGAVAGLDTSTSANFLIIVAGRC